RVRLTLIHSYDTLSLSRDKFIDTPFYIYTTQNLKICNIFKSQYMDTRRLEKWLDIIADQEIF
ncbi:MAG: hypothetical protein MUF15_14805, partial [Acidobacteria bacterium]|nr:hypothetical protein [Acidobacteriota bacterium]